MSIIIVTSWGEPC